MKNKKAVIKLAKLTIQDEKFNREFAKYAITNLSRKDLSDYLRYLKKILSDNFVIVYSKDEIPQKFTSDIERNYKGKKVLYEKDDKITGGIKVAYNDTITDLTVKGYINNALEKLN